MAERSSFDYEIIAVNDCSPDNVFDILKELVNKNPKITVINLARNMGKHAALMAGFSLVRGDEVIVLDDDGQCPMNEMWKLYDALGSEFDVSVASYPHKKQSTFKNFGSALNHLMSRILLSKPKDIQFSNFLIIKRYIIEEMIKYQNPYPYIDGLILRTTRRITCVEMEERERYVGNGNFNLYRSLKLWLNGFTAFSVKPLRIATILGILVAFAGFISSIYIIIKKILNPEMLMGYSSTMAVMLFIGGAVMIMLGLIGEYIGRIYICINNSPQYVIREIVKKGQEIDYDNN